MLVDAKDLKRGMILDLEGDPYADPDKENPVISYQTEYAVVEDVNTGDETCTLVTFYDGVQVGFPPEHSLVFTGEDFYRRGE
jgi:hypothetical protein